MDNLDQLFSLRFTDLEGRAKGDRVAHVPDEGATPPASHLDLRTDPLFGCKRGVVLPIGNDLDSAEQAYTTNVADEFMIGEFLPKRRMKV